MVTEFSHWRGAKVGEPQIFVDQNAFNRDNSTTLYKNWLLLPWDRAQRKYERAFSAECGASLSEIAKETEYYPETGSHERPESGVWKCQGEQF